MFMPIYILLSKLTSEGIKTIKARPELIKEETKKLKHLELKCAGTICGAWHL